jgi:hypothetical protein
MHSIPATRRPLAPSLPLKLLMLLWLLPLLLLIAGTQVAHAQAWPKNFKWPSSRALSLTTGPARQVCWPQSW